MALLDEVCQVSANLRAEGLSSGQAPAPRAKFSLMLRSYWPKEGPASILDGRKPLPINSVA